MTDMELDGLSLTELKKLAKSVANAFQAVSPGEGREL